MILAAAQTKPKRGDIQGNLNDHYRLIEKAAAQGAELIVFPEMSISGYEREEARKLSFSEDDRRLAELQKMANAKRMIIVAGAPIRINADLFIGAFILRPDSAVAIYTKQFLHPGEEIFYKSSFAHNPIIELDKERISLAICADIDNPLHAENAYKAKSTLYIASIFFSPNGIPNAHGLLSSYAEKYSLPVLMANYSGESWGVAAGGRSAFWVENGKLLAEMDNTSSGLMIIEKTNDIWTGQIIADE